MKKGMCRGCDNKVKRPQYQAFFPDGVTRRPKPIEPLKDFCLHFDLHLTDNGGYSYVDRIIEGDEVCDYYHHGGIS